MNRGLLRIIGRGMVAFSMVAVCTVAHADRRVRATDDDKDGEEFTAERSGTARRLAPIVDFSDPYGPSQQVAFDEEPPGESQDLSPSPLPTYAVAPDGKGCR